MMNAVQQLTLKNSRKITRGTVFSHLRNAKQTIILAVTLTS